MSTNVQINVVSADMEKDSIKMKGAGMLKEQAGELSVIPVKTGIKRDAYIYDGKDGHLVAKLNGRDGREK